MAKKSQKEEDVVLDELNVAPVKKETIATRWFKEYAVNNTADMRIVCSLTSRSCEEQFALYLKSVNTEIYAVIYYVTFMTILEFIRNKQKQYNDFSIVIANSIRIGYNNNDDETNEKIGNFMPVMKHVGVNMNVDKHRESKDVEEKYLEWKQINIRQTVEYYKEIQEKAFDILNREYKIYLRTSESVIPIFCIFMDHIVNLIKLRYKEAYNSDVSEVSMNVLNLFDIYYSFDEEKNLEYIEYTPNIKMKLALKSDEMSDK